MYAVIETGGKQYRVSKGDVIKVEKLNAEVGSAIEFDKVLAVGNDGEIQAGTPYISGLSISGKVLEHGKADKVIIFKYKAKKDYRKKQGHRQPYTMIQIEGLMVEKVITEDSPAVEKKPAAKKAPAKKEAVEA